MFKQLTAASGERCASDVLLEVFRAFPHHVHDDGTENVSQHFDRGISVTKQMVSYFKLAQELYLEKPVTER